MTKEQILQAIQLMPEERFEDIDILLERLILLDKIEQGEEDIKAGRVYSNEQMKEIMKSWFKSSGQIRKQRPDCNKRVHFKESAFQAELFLDALYTKAQVLIQFLKLENQFLVQ
ncbi:MAG: hypothetical protein IPM85_11095 [Chitinophagaceae bacterium]|nr:hypothetical protein [Chitinophagaceae bacterium]